MAQTIETRGIVGELRESRQRIADLERELERLREDCRYVAHRARCLLTDSEEAQELDTGHALDVLVAAAGVDGTRIIEPEADDIERAQEVGQTMTIDELLPQCAACGSDDIDPRDESDYCDRCRQETGKNAR